jgi:dTDP-4-dehydrorhamnose 3,5-epimerase
MNNTRTGVHCIFPSVHTDERGYFSELFNVDAWSEEFPNGVRQISQSTSVLNTIRGLHFQHGMNKIMRVLRGSIMLVHVDIRKSSPKFGEHTVHQVYPFNGYVYAPSHYARGFYTHEHHTIVEYFQSSTYDPDLAFTLSYNDPALSIDWPGLPVDHIVSDKDRHGMTLAEWSASPHSDLPLFR